MDIKKAWSSFLKLLSRIIPSAAIITLGWLLFLYLVDDKLPVDNTTALIMVWASVILMLLSFFPNILGKIKKVKIKDFEVELHETLKTQSEEDFNSFDELDKFTFSRKGNISEIKSIIRKARRNPKKPVILTVNLRNGHNISLTMLFMYLFFLHAYPQKLEDDFCEVL